MKNTSCAFTLIEVLIALMILAIALTALLKTNGENIRHTQQIQDKIVRTWVAKQGVTMIQLGLLSLTTQQPASKITHMLGQTWYWRAQRKSTKIPHTYQISITTSATPEGPFADEFIAFGYEP